MSDVVLLARRALTNTGRPAAGCTFHSTAECPALTTSITRYDGHVVAPAWKRVPRADALAAHGHPCNRCPA